MAQIDQLTAEARLRLEIRGAVQGVGFRPFVYRLAADCGLAGWVLNGTSGMVVEAEGGREARAAFERAAADLARLYEAALAEVVRRVGPPAVAPSGGCFQNRLLAERVASAAEALGLPALLHRLVPPNDGGISLGQVAAAAARLRA